MVTFENDNVVFFDCDETLVLWNIPIDTPNDDIIQILTDGFYSTVIVHKEHVKLLKQFKARGHKVIVWSQGGFNWARAVVKSLGLEEFVDLVICKPKWYVDDLPCEAFMGKPYYIEVGKTLPVWKEEE